MALFLPRRWRRQPTGPVRINHGNPVARGIIAAYPMWRGSSWNALGGVATISGTRASGANTAGEWFDLDGSSYLNRGSTLLSSGSSPFTISWYAVAHSVPSFPSVFCTRPTGTSAPFFVIRASDSSGGGNYRLSCGPTIGVTDIAAWRADAGTLPALAVGMEERMLLSCAGGTDSRTLADYRLIRNGVDHGTAPQVCSYGSVATSDEFIGWDGGDGKWDGLLGDFIIWNRKLSVAEALEYEAAPYQIYAPLQRRSYFGVPGDSSVTGTGASTIEPVTSAGAGVHGVSGTAASTVGDVTSSGAAVHGVTGTGASTVGAITSDASGTFVEGGEVTGTGASTVGDITSAGAGVHGVSGTAASTVGEVTSAGTGAFEVSGTGASTIGAIVSTGDGTFASDSDVRGRLVRRRRRRFVVDRRVYDELSPQDVRAAAEAAGIDPAQVREVTYEPASKAGISPTREDALGLPYWTLQEFWGPQAMRRFLDASTPLPAEFFAAGADSTPLATLSLRQQAEQEALLLLLSA